MRFSAWNAVSGSSRVSAWCRVVLCRATLVRPRFGLPLGVRRTLRDPVLDVHRVVCGSGRDAGLGWADERRVRCSWPVRNRRVSAKTLGVLAVLGLVVAFSLSSTLAKRAETPGVLV